MGNDARGIGRAEVEVGTIATDGAEIYYEARGDGRPVLIIQGGFNEAGATEQLADALAADFRVITYDRRGLSRSVVRPDGPPITIARHADDVRAVLAALGTGPALVVGASIGALIGLHLAVRHPSMVATAVAHEPPMSTVVADPDREAALDRIEVMAQQDVRAAIQQMATLIGVGLDNSEAGARPGPMVGDLDANLRWFFSHDFPAVRNSTVDGAEVARAGKQTSIIPTGGTDSRGRWEYRCAHQLAQDLGRSLIELPGGHNGLVTHPWATASQLRRLFMEAEHAAT